MSATQQLLRFGVFELNLDTGELRKSGTVIKLPPQSFRLLVLLASRAGQVVTRENIQKQLWGEETFVDFEHGVNKCVNQIRIALNDNAERPLYVETIPRSGYRFLAPVRSKTVLVPPPRVTESNSEITVIAERVLARIAASAAVASVNTPAPAETVTETPPPVVAPVTKTRFKFPRQWKLLVALLVAAVILASGGLYWRSQHQERLTKKESIVLAEFRNSTGDEALNSDTLNQALSAALRRSRDVDILPRERIVSILKRMSSPADKPLTPQLAREVCRESDADASIAGKIFNKGGVYVLFLRATDCRSGQVLAREEATAPAREKALEALGAAGSKLGSELAELLRNAASAKAVVPEGWYVSGSKPADYEAGTDEQSVYNDHPSAYLKSKRPVEDGFGTLMQGFSAGKYVGKRVRLSGFARSEGVQGWAGSWMRVDQGDQTVCFDNMGNRPIKGTTGWQKYAVVLDVPPDATDISFGVLLGGSGTVWLNSVKFEVVGSEVPRTGQCEPTAMPGDGPANLSFQ